MIPESWLELFVLADMRWDGKTLFVRHAFMARPGYMKELSAMVMLCMRWLNWSEHVGARWVSRLDFTFDPFRRVPLVWPSSWRRILRRRPGIWVGTIEQPLALPAYTHAHIYVHTHIML